MLEILDTAAYAGFMAIAMMTLVAHFIHFIIVILIVSSCKLLITFYQDAVCNFYQTRIYGRLLQIETEEKNRIA